MPTFRHGKSTRLFFDQYDLSSMFRSAGVTVPVDVAETSAFGTQNKTYVTGMKSGGVSAEGMFSGAAGEVDAVLEGVLGVEPKSNLLVTPDGGAILGRRVWMGQVIETSYGVTAPVSDIVSVSAEFQVDAGVDFGYLLHGDVAESSSANYASADFTTTTSAGGVLILSLYANDRDTGSIDLVLEDSANDSTFAAVTGGAFATVNAGVLSTQRIQLAASTAVRRYARIAATVTGGTSGAYTFVIGFAKR